LGRWDVYRWFQFFEDSMVLYPKKEIKTIYGDDVEITLEISNK